MRLPREERGIVARTLKVKKNFFKDRERDTQREMGERERAGRGRVSAKETEKQWQ